MFRSFGFNFKSPGPTIQLNSCTAESLSKLNNSLILIKDRQKGMTPENVFLLSSCGRFCEEEKTSTFQSRQIMQELPTKNYWQICRSQPKYILPLLIHTSPVALSMYFGWQYPKFANRSNQTNIPSVEQIYFILYNLSLALRLPLPRMDLSHLDILGVWFDEMDTCLVYNLYPTFVHSLHTAFTHLF